jgi:hypothetical protein
MSLDLPNDNSWEDVGVELPAAIRGAVQSYLSAADVWLPGFIQGLYITGSIPLGDYRPAISDIDLVAVCAQRPSGPQFEALTALHRPSHPSVDVLYVTGTDLATDPRELSPPHSLQGAFQVDGGPAHPVTWRQLQTTAISVRGPRLTHADVWFDADALRQWNVSNLDSYWAAWLQGWRRREPTEPLVRHESGLQWLVLGVPRLHYTIATLAVTSKTGAGIYALGVADSRWHTVINTAVALRADQSTALPMSVDSLHRDAADLSLWFIEDAHRRSNR